MNKRELAKRPRLLNETANRNNIAQGPFRRQSEGTLYLQAAMPLILGFVYFWLMGGF